MKTFWIVFWGLLMLFLIRFGFEFVWNLLH